MSERYVRKNGERYVRKNVRKICQKICHQKECQKICQKECQKICQKDVRNVRKNVRRYVRKNVIRYVRQNVRKYVPSICAYIDLDNKNSCLHQRNLVDGILFLVYLAHCSKYCWLNFVFVQGSEFGMAGRAEVVVERPETIFIGTANRVAKGVEHVWRYKLTFLGAERMYVCMEPPSTTHAGDLMFIMEEVVEGNKWYVAYEGRPVSKMCGAGRPTQKWWKNRSGELRASWCAHAMRCSCGSTARIASLRLSCFLAGRSDACGVCVWNYRRFACLDLTAFWPGGPMH